MHSIEVEVEDKFMLKIVFHIDIYRPFPGPSFLVSTHNMCQFYQHFFLFPHKVNRKPAITGRPYFNLFFDNFF